MSEICTIFIPLNAAGRFEKRNGMRRISYLYLLENPCSSDAKIVPPIASPTQLKKTDREMVFLSCMPSPSVLEKNTLPASHCMLRRTSSSNRKRATVNWAKNQPATTAKRVER